MATNFNIILHMIILMIVVFFNKSTGIPAVVLFLLVLFFPGGVCVAGDRRNTVDLLGLKSVH